MHAETTAQNQSSYPKFGHVVFWRAAGAYFPLRAQLMTQTNLHELLTELSCVPAKV